MSSKADTSNVTETFMDKDGNFFRTTEKTDGFIHKRCQKLANKACEKDDVVNALFIGMKELGCEINFDSKKLSCEPCTSKMFGAFDTEKKEIIICENNIWTQTRMNEVMKSEIIHAYDVARVKFDKENLNHLACTSIRVANLSGKCLYKAFFIKDYKPACVRNYAIKNMMCSKSISEEEASKVIDTVFDDCYNDYAPFQEMPS